MNGGEIVLLGAGLGFKRKPGDTVEETKIEKQFVLKGKANLASFEKLAAIIPTEYFTFAERLITLARDLYDLELRESIHLSLADHIHSAVENYQAGIYVTNTVTLEIQQFYPHEFDIGQRGIKMIRDEFGVDLPIDEAGFIAMHFANAEVENSGVVGYKLVSLAQELHDLIVANITMMPDKSSIAYYRYMTHLKCFAKRILLNYHFKDEDMGLLDFVQIQYRDEYACIKKVAEYVEKNYG